MPQSRNFEKMVAFIFVAALAVVGVYFQAQPTTTVSNGTAAYILDVGQGDSILFRTKGGKYVLVDGGPDKKVLTELGEVIPPTVHSIDTVVLTHPHADHVAGLNYVLDRYQIGQVYLTGAVHTAPEYLEFLKLIKEQNIKANKAYLGQEFSVDELGFKILYPNSDISGEKPKDQNDGSVVLLVNSDGHRALLLGDLSAKLQDKYLLEQLRGSKVDVLKVSHHGSKTGTSAALLDIIKPDYAAISVGKNNDFGHPAPFTLAQLSGYKVLRTDQNGRIGFMISSNGFTLY